MLCRGKSKEIAWTSVGLLSKNAKLSFSSSYHSHLPLGKSIFPSYLFFFACSTIILWWFFLPFLFYGLMTYKVCRGFPLRFESEPEQRLAPSYRNLTNSHFNHCLLLLSDKYHCFSSTLKAMYVVSCPVYNYLFLSHCKSLDWDI